MNFFEQINISATIHPCDYQISPFMLLPTNGTYSSPWKTPSIAATFPLVLLLSCCLECGAAVLDHENEAHDIRIRKGAEISLVSAHFMKQTPHQF